MNKKIMVVVFTLSLFQSIGAESFDDCIFEEQSHGHVLTDIQVTKEPTKQDLTVWTALKLAPRYIYETHFKPNFNAMVAVFFKRKKGIDVKG